MQVRHKHSELGVSLTDVLLGKHTLGSSSEYYYGEDNVPVITHQFSESGGIWKGISLYWV